MLTLDHVEKSLSAADYSDMKHRGVLCRAPGSFTLNYVTKLLLKTDTAGLNLDLGYHDFVFEHGGW